MNDALQSPPPVTSSAPSATPHKAEHRARKWLWTLARWAIAIFGIGYVLSNISWNDRVLVPNASDGWPVAYRLAQAATEDSPEYVIRESDGSERAVPRSSLLVKADSACVSVREDDGSTT